MIRIVKSKKQFECFRDQRRDTGLLCNPGIFGTRLAAGPAEDFGAKNLPPEGFLNAPHPLGVQVPSLYSHKKYSNH